MKRIYCKFDVSSEKLGHRSVEYEDFVDDNHDDDLQTIIMRMLEKNFDLELIEMFSNESSLICITKDNNGLEKKVNVSIPNRINITKYS